MTRPLFRSLVAVVAAACALPGVANAAGFAEPVTISGHDDAGAPSAVIAPNGRTAVLWEREIKVGRRYRAQWRLATGPSPAALGRPKTLTLAGPPHRYGSPAPFLLARPDGALVLCVRTGPTKGCAIAPPNGAFGPVIGVRAGKRGFTAVVRPDNSLLIVYSSTTATGDGEITGTAIATTTMSPGGELGTERTLVRTKDEQAYNGSVEPVITADGTVAVPALLPLPGRGLRIQIGVRLMAPGTDTFGPILPVPGAIEDDNNIQLTGGRRLTVSYAAQPAGAGYDAPYIRRVFALEPGAAFSAAALLPTTTTVLPGIGGDVTRGHVLALPDGELLAVTERSTTAIGDSDCLNPIAGEIAAGPLAATPARAQRLSTRGQVAVYPNAAALDDGTVIASWVDGAGEGSGKYRVEASIREPGAAAFSAGRRLPRIGNGTQHVLISNGNAAALLWTVRHATRDSNDWRQEIVLSSYTRTGPVARQAPLPNDPGTSCDD